MFEWKKIRLFIKLTRNLKNEAVAIERKKMNKPINKNLKANVKLYSAKISFIAFLFYLSVDSAFGQCRIGNGPDFGDGIPYCSEIQDEEAQIPQQRWQSKWGAIAIDPNVRTGGIGYAENVNTRASAEAIALKQCRDAGGTKTCRIQVSYDNQCGVIAWGDDYFTTANAEMIEDASSIAFKACSEKTTNCKIFYSNCNYAVEVK